MAKHTKNIVEIVFLFIAFIVFFFISDCPLQSVTGLPCPGCNMTSALYYLLLGNVKTALFYHPLVIVLIICTVLEIILYLKYKSFNTKYAKVVFYLFIILLIVVYVYRMLFVFPSIPMVYVEDNFIMKIRALF